MNILLWTGALWLMTEGIEGYIVLVDSYGEECFWTEAEEGGHLSLRYEVLDGGWHEVDARILDPAGEVPYTAEKSHGDQQGFRVNTGGRFGLCFGNWLSSKSPKLVLFDLTASPRLELTEPAQGQLTATEVLTRQLRRGLRDAETEMAYLAARLATHNLINEQTNSSLFVWALSQLALIVGLCLLQTYYLLKFFETKRIV